MKDQEKLTINKETIDVLVANVIPTTKYFETRFDFLQHQVNEIKVDIDGFKKDVDRRFVEVKEDISEFKKDVDRRFVEVKEDISEFKKDVDRRFVEVNRRFEEIDKRFEQVDKRFEQVDKRFEEVEERLKNIEKSIVDLTIEIKELSKNQEVTIREYIIERDRYYDKKFTHLRNFNIAIVTLIAGLVLKSLGVLDKFFH